MAPVVADKERSIHIPDNEGSLDGMNDGWLSPLRLFSSPILSMHCVRCALQTYVVSMAAGTCIRESRGELARILQVGWGTGVQVRVECMLSAEGARNALCGRLHCLKHFCFSTEAD